MAASWTPSARLKQIAVEKAQPLSATLELTYKCNWRCVFCYNPRHRDLRGLSGAEWLKVLDDLRALGTLYVALTGGEPLTHPDFMGIARGARERALALRILTNGALITDKVADEIADLKVLAVEMSLHGARAETHDRATATRGSFEALFRGLDRLRARGVSAVLKTPLTRINEDEIEPMHALAEARDVPWRVDPVLTPRDDGDAGPLAWRPSTAAIQRIYQRLADAGQLPHEERSKGGVNCGLGSTTLAIDPEGNVYPCMQWRKAPLGNVREVPLADLWPTSSRRLEAAAVARTANDQLVSAGEALATFPFCPALAEQNGKDPLRPDPHHEEQAEIALRLRRSPEVMFRAGGVLFAVEPPGELTEAELIGLARLDPAGVREAELEKPFRIRLEPEPPWTSDDPELFPRWDPAVQRWHDERLLVSHRSFTAEIDPVEAWARVHRREERAYPLEAVIRTAMMARLPLVGGLPLHAAGVVADGRGLAFFGPSGAGKSTLAETSPHPVLSDELVALGPGGDPPFLVRSGFWGEGAESGRPAGAPLAALVALDQGPRFALTRLGPVEAVRGLTASVPVPLAAPLWSRALAVAAATVTRVPVYRMAWTPAEPPWDRLAETLEKA